MKAMTIGANGAFEWKEVGEPQLGGGYAERVAVPEGMCMLLPKGFSFEQAAEAHRMMVAGENRGKIVMTI